MAAERQKRERKERMPSINIPFKDTASMTQLSPTKLHLLEVPLPPTVSQSGDPSLQNMGIWEMFKLQPVAIPILKVCKMGVILNVFDSNDDNEICDYSLKTIKYYGNLVLF
jgi:hypothetical protein